MTAALAAPTSTTASIQVGGVDQLTLTSAGGGTLRAGPTAGDRTLALATMKMFADEFTNLKSANGWQKLPSGLIIQWVAAKVTHNELGQRISLPIAFPNAALNVTGSIGASISTGVVNRSLGAEVFSTTQISATVQSTVTGDSGCTFVAIGY